MIVGNVIKSHSGSGLWYTVARVETDGTLILLDAHRDGTPNATETGAGRRYGSAPERKDQPKSPSQRQGGSAPRPGFQTPRSPSS